jgi:hypothetical protein
MPAVMVIGVACGPSSVIVSASQSSLLDAPGYLRARRPEIAGDVVYRGSVLSAAPARLTCPPRHTAPAPPLVTFPVTQKALSLPGKGLDLRKLVAGAGFEPATSGL